MSFGSPDRRHLTGYDFVAALVIVLPELSNNLHNYPITLHFLNNHVQPFDQMRFAVVPAKP